MLGFRGRPAIIGVRAEAGRTWRALGGAPGARRGARCTMQRRRRLGMPQFLGFGQGALQLGFMGRWATRVGEEAAQGEGKELG